MEKVFVFVCEHNNKFEIVPSPKGGWIVRKPFMLIDKNFSPLEGVTIYEGKIVKTITDKRGQQVPILGELTPHTCNIKCGEGCSICGKKIDHDFEVIRFSTETECERRKYVCKKCGFVEEIEGLDHYFEMEQEGVLICGFCGFSKSVEVTDEVIREYAVPPFPLERVLKAWNLTMEEIINLHKKSKQVQNMQPIAICSSYDEKLKRSIKFWEEKTISYDDFLKFIPKDIIDYQRSNLIRIKREDSYVLVSKDEDIFFDEENLCFFTWQVDKVESIPTQSGYRWSTSYYKRILYNLSDIDELLSVLDIYDKNTTFAKKKEADEKYKLTCQKYEEEKKKWEQVVDELKKDPVYKKLFDFLTSSLYGEKLRYAVDPYDGYFGGLGIRPQELTEIFFKGIELLGLLKK